MTRRAAPDRTTLSSAARAAGDLGRRHEAGLADDQRRRGAHFTPVEVAAALVDRALEAWSGAGVPTVLDPAAGAGAFLVAAADRLVAAGRDPSEVLGALRGVEVDAATAAAARAALALWADAVGAVGTPRVEVGDGLALGSHGADLVVGNPPFQGQLRRATARSAAASAELRRRLGPDVVDRTTDTAALFLASSAVGLAPGGVVAMLQPRSMLAGAGGRGVRTLLAPTLVGAWLPEVALFDASVDVCAVVAARPASPGIAADVAVWTGAHGEREVARVARRELGGATWSTIVARAEGVPPMIGTTPPGRLGDVATAAAGFRDEFYGIAAAVVEGRPPGEGARLLTTGLVDPHRSRWGGVEVRVAGRRWREPWVDLDRLDAEASPRVVRWVTGRRGPKVVVATQTRVIEAIADPEGEWVPMTPLVSVSSDALRPAEVLAALLSPPATVWAHHHHAGAGRARGTLRLAGRDVLGIPLPVDRTAWGELASCLDAGHVVDWDRFGRLGCRAWGWSGSDAGRAVEWWLEQMPDRAR